MNGRTLAIHQCAEPRDISRTHATYRGLLLAASNVALFALSIRPKPESDALARLGVSRVAHYARKLIRLRKRANYRRMAQGLAPWCVLCGAESHFDNSDQPRHMAGDDRSHKARV